MKYIFLILHTKNINNMYACYVIHFKFSWEKEDVPLRDNDAALL